MKLRIILASCLFACSAPKPAPVSPPVSPTPPAPVSPVSPTPVGPVQPEANCDGVALGGTRDLGCPAGTSGTRMQVCQKAGWHAVDDTCKAPVVPPSPTPPALPALEVELPNVYKVKSGNRVALELRPVAGVSYLWSTGETGPTIWVTPTADSVYTVTATRAADGAVTSAAVAVILL